MTNNSRVTHAVRGYTMKFGQVQKRIAENSCFVWVKYGETFRDATIAEAAQMRKEQAKLAEPIPFAELPGLMFRKPNPTSVSGAEVSWTCSNRRCQNPVEFGETLCPTCQAPTRQGFTLVKQANQFCQAHG